MLLNVIRFILRTLLFVLVAHLVFRMVRAFKPPRRAVPPAPPPGRRPPEIDPRDIVDATFREVDAADRVEGKRERKSS